MTLFIRVLWMFFLVIQTSNAQIQTLPHSQQRSQQVERVLFVGNSLLYVGNVPAVFSALSKANQRSIQADMIVRGGATLTDRLDDGMVESALKKHRYDVMVLQERGGELMGAFGDIAQAKSKAALKSYAALAQQAGIRVFLLGSYQPSASPSQTLVRMEENAAIEAGVTYIEISERLRHLRQLHADMAWFSTDGSMHPGKDLALLNAVLVYQTIFGDMPNSFPFTVNAPMYTARYSPNLALMSAEAANANKEIEQTVIYPLSTLRLVIDNLVMKPKVDK